MVAFVSLMDVLVGVSTVLSILSITWHIRNEWLDRRPRLTVSTEILERSWQPGTWIAGRWVQEDPEPDPTLQLRAVNKGKLPITIEAWGFLARDATTWNASEIGSTSRELPVKLEQGDVLLGELTTQNLLEKGLSISNLKRVWVQDVSQRHYYGKGLQRRE